jgi:lipid-A-disaccharide synthase-like uncharacterized protein
MRQVLIKIIIFIVFLIILTIINISVFRSDVPLLWFITFIGSVIGLIYFPYKRMFKIK